MFKKIMTWGSVAFLVFFVAYRPDVAAEIARSIGSGLGQLAMGFVNFLRDLL